MQALFSFIGKKEPTLEDLFDCAILSTDARETVTCEDMHLRTDLVQG